jgi:vesicle-fusing ATPase
MGIDNANAIVQLQIQRRYETHRTNRNQQQKDKILSPSFTAFSPDEILAKLEDKQNFPDYIDPRHCLVLWARPTQAVKDIIRDIQHELKSRFPNIWLMPEDSLHMTTMEITHSREEHEIDKLVETMKGSVVNIVNFTQSHQVRLIKPKIGYDTSALALSFIPAAGETLSNGRTLGDDTYTYTHLRRDLFDECTKAGVEVGSRYVVETAHLTIARFVNEKDFEEQGVLDGEKVKELVRVIEEISERLERGYWPEERTGKVKKGGEWIVGADQGLTLRRGTVWYGGGETVGKGDGFRE